MKVKIDAQATLGHIVRVLGACIVGVEGCFVQSDDVLRFLSELEVDAALGHVVVRGDGVGERIGVNADRGCELLNRRALGDGRLLASSMMDFRLLPTMR